ncbi:PstS family phosphate ABC transporter substrate-binding protein [Chloroflexota bacterium]
MHKPLHPTSWLLVLSLACLLAATGCYRGVQQPTSQPAALPQWSNQTIAIDGSGLMAPVVTALGTAFQTSSNTGQIEVGQSGTRTGFTQFCTGATVIQNALRPMGLDELTLCNDHEITWLMITLAYDAVAVVTAPENEVGCLSQTQLKSIWRNDSMAQSWRQINLHYPDMPLAVYAPAEATLPYTLFQQIVLDGTPYRQAMHQGLPVGADAIGFVPYEQARQRSGSLNILPLDLTNDGLCTIPGDALIRSGDYALARPLLMYINAESLQRPEVAQFLQFALSPAADETIQQALLTPPSANNRQQDLQRLGLTM